MSRHLFDILAFTLLLCSFSLKLVVRQWANGYLKGCKAVNETLDVERTEVLLAFDNWTRYKLNSTLEWAALVPDGGIVHGPAKEPYTVAMMHQLRCLDIVRDQLTRPRARRDNDSTHHCMNYLRSAIMCHADTFLDPILYPSELKTVDNRPVRRCLDWRAVHNKVRSIQEERSHQRQSFLLRAG